MLTEQEKEIVNFGKQNGKSDQEIMTALSRYRTENVVATNQSKPTTQDRLAQVGAETSGRITQAIQGTGGMQDASLLRRGVEATAAGFSSVPKGAVALAPEPVRKAIDYVGGKIGSGFKKLTESIGDTELFKGAAGQQVINPDGTVNYVENDLGKIEDALGIASAGGEIAGNITAAQGVVKTGNIVKSGAGKTADVAKGVIGVTKESLKEIPSIKSLRLKLSDVDPQVETVLKRSNADEVNRYFQQAQNAKADPAKSTPLELAGTKAEEAFDVINKARQDALMAKKKKLNEAGANTLIENPAGTTIDKIKSDVSERFGVEIRPDGTLISVQGRISKLDAPSQALLSEYVTKLRQLGIKPTAQKTDDFIDWAQGQLYKQSKEVSKLQSADDALVSYLKGVTGELNDNLKAQIGGGYGEINSRISSLITLQDELSSALGADARKGGGLMKKIFSPTGGDTRRIFEEIKNETGIDLFKEATLAKFAMESVGDVRQKSLLKQLDVALQDTATLDITKPLSIVRWLREKADLDGQELANQLLREINASSDVKK